MQVLDLFSLSGKTALLIGASGRYGKQIAKALVQAGATTYVTTRQPENIPSLEQQFVEDSLDLKVIYVDQSIESTIEQARDLIIQQTGRIDVLINNAVARPMSGWNDDTEIFAESMKVNATGIYSLTKIIGNVMEKQQSGSIINISSIQGMVGPDHTLYEGFNFHGFVPDYFFHKGGMINFTKFVASYYGRSGVRCNCLSPGGIESSVTPPEFIKRYSDRTLLGRMANQTDLIGSVIYLASDASLYVTGTNIPVDGGYTAK